MSTGLRASPDKYERSRLSKSFAQGSAEHARATDHNSRLAIQSE